MKKVLLVFGTRPEAIKMAPLVKCFQQYTNCFKTEVCVTGQHRQMLDSVLNVFDIQPEYDLNIMKNGQNLFEVTSRVLNGMAGILEQSKPDIVLVHGDTTTSTAAALAAFYMQIPVGHVEAGLRTHNIYSPWPEEMNRQLTGRIARFHFCPTLQSRQNLLSENVEDTNICVTGNTVIDALFWVVNRLKSSSQIAEKQVEAISMAGYPISKKTSAQKIVLITGHRRENFGDGFRSICKAIKRLSEHFPDVDFIYPMHLNPNVRKPIEEIFGSAYAPNMYFIEPLDYFPFITLMEKATLVLTDSGGIQEEAPGLGKPVLVMRDTTERPEAVTAGTVRLVGTDEELIYSETAKLLTEQVAYNAMSMASNPYGDGHACKRIVEKLMQVL